MDHETDFSALRNLLALRRLDVPMDTEVNRFLIEFHRRQRAQLLVKETAWVRLTAWLGEKVRIVPSLSYASGFAAIALLGLLAVSAPQRVTATVGHYQLSLSMPGAPSTFALLPTAYHRDASSSRSDTFTSSARSNATRFVLANSRVAYDATAAF